MLSTTILLAAIGGVLATMFACWALMLRLGLRWAKAGDVTVRRIAAAVAVVFLLQILLNIVAAFVPPPPNVSMTFWCGKLLVAGLIAPCLVIARAFKLSFLRAVQAWSPTLLVGIASLAFVAFVFKPFLFEAFVCPTNAMAPTLLGNHHRGVCRECGATNYGSANVNPFDRQGPPKRLRMICESGHVEHSEHFDRAKRQGDRFLVAKFLTPRRWDLMIFQYPDDPSKLYVKRLVGLPGEEIRIVDGAVWADGEQLTPPESMGEIQYQSEWPEGPGPFIHASEAHPMRLAADEYFVLGDFSAQSSDSRVWGAVPESNIEGVVTHTYWPPGRWRVHR